MTEVAVYLAERKIRRNPLGSPRTRIGFKGAYKQLSGIVLKVIGVVVTV